MKTIIIFCIFIPIFVIGADKYAGESFDNWAIDRLSERAIIKLVESGRICRIRGHVWIERPATVRESKRGVIRVRRCVVCGETQEQIAGVWK